MSIHNIDVLNILKSVVNKHSNYIEKFDTESDAADKAVEEKAAEEKADKSSFNIFGPSEYSTQTYIKWMFIGFAIFVAILIIFSIIYYFVYGSESEIQENKNIVSTQYNSPQQASQASYSPRQASQVSYSPQQASQVSYSPQQASQVSYSPQQASQVSYSPQQASQVSYFSNEVNKDLTPSESSLKSFYTPDEATNNSSNDESSLYNSVSSYIPDMMSSKKTQQVIKTVGGKKKK